MTINVWSKGESNATKLSNLAKRPFKYQGRQYYSVEHAYQSLKSGQFDPAVYGKSGWQNGGVKITGNRKPLTKDNYNIDLMYILMLESFEQNRTAALALLGTGTFTLTHNNPNGRTDIWTKKFPELLTKVREELGIREVRSTEMYNRHKGVDQRKLNTGFSIAEHVSNAQHWVQHC